MRVKRRSRHRKVVKFYSTCFGFREPYKVLVDGTFVHHLLVHQLLPAADALRELLSAARAHPLFTSKCVQAELHRLGKSHSQAFDAAQLFATASCEHEKVVSAVDCILSLVVDKNPEHYFVATQDSNLRAKLPEVDPCVPVIYGLKNSLFIEQPSVHDRKFAQLDEEKRIHMEKSEFKKLLKVSSEGKTSVDGNIPGVKAEKSKFIRNRAKGSNPLSCKKKKPKPQPSTAQNQIIITTQQFQLTSVRARRLMARQNERGLGRGREATKTAAKQRQRADGHMQKLQNNGAILLLWPQSAVPHAETICRWCFFECHT